MYIHTRAQSRSYEHTVIHSGHSSIPDYIHDFDIHDIHKTTLIQLIYEVESLITGTITPKQPATLKQC